MRNNLILLFYSREGTKLNQLYRGITPYRNRRQRKNQLYQRILGVNVEYISQIEKVRKLTFFDLSLVPFSVNINSIT